MVFEQKTYIYPEPKLTSGTAYTSMFFRKTFIGCIVTLLLFSCSNKKNTALQQHFTENVFTHADSLWAKSSRFAAFAYLDSVYSTFAEISVKDKCRYFLFKAKIQDFHKLGMAYTDSAVLFTDSILQQIEGNNLTGEMPREYANVFRIRTIKPNQVNRIGIPFKLFII